MTSQNLSLIHSLRRKTTLMKKSINQPPNPQAAAGGSTPAASAMAMVVPKPAISDEQEKELHAAFGQFDNRGVGLVSSRAIIISLRAMGFRPTSKRVAKYIEQFIGPKGNHEIDFKDYHTLMSNLMLRDEAKSEAEMLFKSLCNPKTRVITIDNLIETAKLLNQEVSLEELQEMISFASTSPTGKEVSLEDFIKIVSISKKKMPNMY